MGGVGLGPHGRRFPSSRFELFSVICMMELPAVSIIIPTYNRAEFVKEAIDSVFHKRFRTTKSLLSTTGRLIIPKKFFQIYGNRIKHLHQINSGVGAARNAGIRLAEGEWLAFLDSDDIWKPEYLSCQVERAKQNPSICTHMTNSIRVEADGSTIDTFNLLDSMLGEHSRMIRVSF